MIERAVLLKIASKFGASWDVKFVSRLTPGGKEIQGEFGETSGKIIRMDKLKEKFRHNKLIYDKWAGLVPPSFILPPNSSIETLLTGQGEHNLRSILIKSREAELEISIRTHSGGTAEGGIWGILPPNKNLYTLSYRITVKIRLAPWKDTPTSKVYERWYENMINSLSELDFQSIDKEVEKALMRQMLESSRQ